MIRGCTATVNKKSEVKSELWLCDIASTALILRQVKRWQFPVFHSASRPIREIALVALDGYRNSEKYIHQTKKFLDLFAYLLERFYACMTVLVIAIACKPALEKR